MFTIFRFLQIIRSSNVKLSKTSFLDEVIHLLLIEDFTMALRIEREWKKCIKFNNSVS